MDFDNHTKKKVEITLNRLLKDYDVQVSELGAQKLQVLINDLNSLTDESEISKLYRKIEKTIHSSEIVDLDEDSFQLNGKTTLRYGFSNIHSNKYRDK